MEKGCLVLSHVKKQTQHKLLELALMNSLSLLFKYFGQAPSGPHGTFGVRKPGAAPGFSVFSTRPRPFCHFRPDTL